MNQPKKKSLLITGATGYIGTQMLPRLLARQDLKITGLYRNTVSKNTDTAVTWLNESQLLKILKIQSFDCIIHLATHFTPRHQSSDIDPIIESNIRLPLHILDLATSHPKPVQQNFINLSTYWNHFDNQDYAPVSLYSASKSAFDRLLQYYCECKSVHAITLELGDVYGPDDDRKKALNYLLDAAKKNETVHMTEGNQILPIVHVDDVVRGIEIAMDRLLYKNPNTFEIFSLPPNEQHTIREITSIIENLLGRKIPALFGERPYRDHEFFSPWLPKNILPGWKTQIALDAGLKKLLF